MRHTLVRRIPQVLIMLLWLLMGLRPATAASHAVGVNAHQPSSDVLDAIQDLGVGWVRIDLNWLQAAPRKDRYDWALFDAIIDGAVRRGLKVFPTLSYGPAWATEPDSDGIPSNNTPKVGEYQKFCQAVATRYGGKITHFGLWNEPNLAGFFEGTMQQWIDRVVIEGIRGIKAGCPTCKVLGPELATIGKDYANYLDASLVALKRAGLMYDAVSWHIYANFPDLDPSLLLCTGDSFFHKLDAHRVCKLGGLVVYEGPLSVREVLLKHGLSALPVWITETGRTAAIDDSKRKTEQATYYRRVLEEQLKRGWYENTFFYEIVDDNTIADKWGMAVQSGGSYPASYRKKPAWDLLHKALESPGFGGRGSECSDGLDNDGDRAIDYPKDSDCASASGPSEGPPRAPLTAEVLSNRATASPTAVEAQTPGDYLALIPPAASGCSLTPGRRDAAPWAGLLSLLFLGSCAVRRRARRIGPAVPACGS